MLSTWYSGVAFVLLAVGLAWLGIRLVHRRELSTLLRRHNEIAGPIHATLGVIYAVLLAFVVITVWEQFTDAENALAAEANVVTALVRNADGIDSVSGERLRTELITYIRSIVETEWPIMAEEEDIQANGSYDRIWQIALRIKPQDAREETWLAALIAGMDRLDNARNARILAVDSAVPTAMWVLLIIGGIITVLFACFFGAEHRHLHFAMVAALAATIAFTLFMIAAIDHPYRGLVHVETEAYEHVLEQLKHLE